MKIIAKFDLTIAEVQLLEEALLRAAARLYSLGRASPTSAGPHERKAIAMSELRQRLKYELIKPAVRRQLEVTSDGN
jgi:hypothetical protein